jgi:hypothetical protein
VAQVVVSPTTYTYVFYDADTISAVASKLLDQMGLDVALRVEVDETTPMGRARLTSLEPLTIHAESGAFEDLKRPRQLSEDRTADVVGRLLLKAKDRMDPAFGDPPPDDSLTLAQAAAWDVYAVGRLVRLGYAGQRQRRLYQFRNRHGFTDAADAAFERLWTAESLTWADIDAVCKETAATTAA